MRYNKKLTVFILISTVLVATSIGIYFIVDDSSRSAGSQPSKGAGSQPNANPSQSPSTSFEPVGCIRTPIESIVDTPQENYESIVLISDVVYGKGAVSNGEKDLILDIYHPSLNNDDEKYPLMIHIHGGAFIFGSKNDDYMTALSYYWASKGFVVASINYRLMGDSPVVSEVMKPVVDYTLSNLPQLMNNRLLAEAATSSVEDTLLAYDYLSGLSYVDDTAVVINGYSAGAIASLWAAYGVDNFGIPRPSVKAVISHWGLLLSEQEETNKFVTGDKPPVFLIHTTGDQIVPYHGTQYLANRMHSLGLNYALHCEESSTHGMNIDLTTHTNGMSILEAERIWLRNILYGS
mmetsp:Transcript_9288/g.13809  ORF Transcript_9288/g.13809 Transcript_9288/m.13809 type:complete len:349 (+) Transcript_9288:37-1083(+)